MTTAPRNWIPEICYEEESEGISSHIPFIQVPLNEQMPQILYIFESQETGDFEPGLDGGPVPVVQLDLHQYADLAVLKSKLDGRSYDVVRAALGLEPLLEAAEKGQKITADIRENIENNLQ